MQLGTRCSAELFNYVLALGVQRPLLPSPPSRKAVAAWAILDVILCRCRSFKCMRIDWAFGREGVGEQGLTDGSSGNREAS